MLSEAMAEQQRSGQAPHAIVVCSLAGITALRATDGALLWMHPLPSDRHEVVWPNLVSDCGVIYLGVAFRARGIAHRAARVIALSARDGAALWQTDLPELEGPPVLAVAGERVAVMGSVSNRAVVALDAQTGAIRWMKPNLRSWSSRIHAGWNAVVRWAALSEYLDLPQNRGTYQLLAACHGAVYLSASDRSSLLALDANTGAERWRSALRGVSTQIAVGATQVVTEAITPQGCVIAVLRADDGATLHMIPVERERERPLLLTEEGVVYLMRGPELCAVRVSSRRSDWRNAQVLDEPSSSSGVALEACLTDQTLFYHWGQRVPARLTVGALDRQTGEKRWEWRAEEEIARASGAVNLVGGDGQLYIATGRGLFAFREHDGQALWHVLPATDLSVVQPALATGKSV